MFVRSKTHNLTAEIKFKPFPSTKTSILSTKTLTSFFSSKKPKKEISPSEVNKIEIEIRREVEGGQPEVLCTGG